jgi:hypothetical protein
MPGRPLPDESMMRWGPYAAPDMARRREVLRETLAALAAAPGRYHRAAERNHAAWRARRRGPPPSGEVRVYPGDWGEVAAALSREHGETFAVLNMANAFVAGGAYAEGAVAQEENMFRRTDCHFAVDDEQLAPDGHRYAASATALISAAAGRVYLDAARPRVCVRGPEDRRAADLGYRWLADDEVFQFYELRAAAVDLGDGRPYDHDEMRRRIAAQIATLRDAGVRYAVLGAFGCGAFRNPAPRVAELYREALAGARDDFALVAFAIFHAGYGPDNYAPFRRALAPLSPDAG